MFKAAFLAAVFAVLLTPVVVHALSPEEVELLRRAGVSEEGIQKMMESDRQREAEKAQADAPPRPVDAPAPAPPPPVAAPVQEKAAPAPPAFRVTDWDEDGVNDIIAGTESGELNVYINSGSNREPRFEHRDEVADGEVDSGTVSVPCVVDWDNDGLKDVLMGNRGGTVYVYINKGTNARPDFGGGYELEDGDVDAGSYSAPAVVDWDADGRKDLILGNFKGELLVYMNRGSDESPRFGDEPEEVEFDISNYSTFNFTTPSITKGRGDGLFDILTGAGNGRVYRFINHGSPGRPRFQSPQHIMVNDFIFELAGNTNVIAADWDGDGREDLLVSNRTTAQTQGTDSAGGFTKPSDADKGISRVYLLRNVGTNKEPRYEGAVEILKDRVDINL